MQTTIQTNQEPIDKDQLRLFLECMLVPHTAFITATKCLEQAFRVSSTIRDPIGYFISGESRTGKTRLIEDFAAQYPKYRLPEGLIVPVLHVEVPSKPTVKGLAAEILAALGDPLADKGTEQEKTRRVVTYLQKCQTKVLVLDEFHNFVDKSSNFAVIHHVSDWLKNLLNKAKIVTVIVGLPYGEAVLSQNEQLRGRFTKSFHLPRFNWQDEALQGEFLGLLDGFTELLREHFTIKDLGGEEMAYRFYLATGGLTGYVFNILRLAAWNVIDEDRTSITINDLDIAYNIFISDVDRHALSPFSPKFNLTDVPAFEKASKIGARSVDYAPEKTTRRYKPRSTREALAV